MKAGWEELPLKALCENYRDDIVDGPFGSNLKREHFEPVGVPVLKIQNIKPFRIVEKSMDYVSPEKAQELSRHSFVRGDIIVTKLGTPLGISAIVESEIPGIIVADLVRVRAQKIDTEFLCYQLNSPRVSESLNALQGGATRPRVRIEALRDLRLAVPPLEEQQRIVAILDEAFEGLARARAHAEANLQNARELFAGAIAEEFSGKIDAPKKKICDVALHSLGKMLDKNKNKGHPRGYLRNLNVRWFEFDTSDILEMRIEDHEVERYSVKRGDLLICEGGYPGRCAVWDQDELMFFQKALHRVRFDNAVYGRLLMFFLYMEDQSGSLKTHFSGSGIQHFTGQALAEYEMPYPAPKLAEAMVARIEAMQLRSRELEASYVTKLQSLDALRQSLLQKAFAGEMT